MPARFWGCLSCSFTGASDEDAATHADANPGHVVTQGWKS